jgi:hypothetical protein
VALVQKTRATGRLRDPGSGDGDATDQPHRSKRTPSSSSTGSRSTRRRDELRAWHRPLHQTPLPTRRRPTASLPQHKTCANPWTCPFPPSDDSSPTASGPRCARARVIYASVVQSAALIRVSTGTRLAHGQLIDLGDPLSEPVDPAGSNDSASQNCLLVEGDERFVHELSACLCAPSPYWDPSPGSP